MRRDVRGRVLMIASVVGMALVIGAGIRDALSRNQAEPEVLETCCDSGTEPRRAPAIPIPTALNGGDPMRGQQTYVALCANCHDTDGSGRRGRPSYPNIRDVRTATKQQTVTAVVRGKGLMPAFGGLIEEAELRDLLAYRETQRLRDR